ncbi:hypothetical protein MP228_007597 [Amoeboaphelidium protococcarum]|nr:hypothetical protein MP228_007597 [Amoeboaphelidium protococcarum]
MKRAGTMLRYISLMFAIVYTFGLVDAFPYPNRLSTDRHHSDRHLEHGQVQRNNDDRNVSHLLIASGINSSSAQSAIPVGSLAFYWRLGAILLLLLLAAVVSGLTLGYMSLDENSLRIIRRSGTEQQKRCAALVEPLRKKGHLLLCTLLIANMLANETLPILFDDLIAGGGLYAVIISTALIVLFAEIIPQAVCSRHGLVIGARMAWLVRILMFILYPIAWPIAKLLTLVLGTHKGVVYRRAELKELVDMHSKTQLGDLSQDEVRVIKSVLDVKSMQIQQLMTPLDKAFVLDIDTVLDDDALKVINALGYSRIPVFKTYRSNIIGNLLVKRLICSRFEGSITDKEHTCRIRDVKSHAVVHCLHLPGHMEAFDALRKMREARCHLAIIIEKTKGCIEHSAIGIITMEDIIERMIGSDILDETDMIPTIDTKQMPQCLDRNQISVQQKQINNFEHGLKHKVQGKAIRIRRKSTVRNRMRREVYLDKDEYEHLMDNENRVNQLEKQGMMSGDNIIASDESSSSLGSRTIASQSSSNLQQSAPYQIESFASQILSGDTLNSGNNMEDQPDNDESEHLLNQEL